MHGSATNPELIHLSRYATCSRPCNSTVRRELYSLLATTLSKKLDGKTAAAATIRRKRAIFRNSPECAVKAELLTENPPTRIKWKAPGQAEQEADPARAPDRAGRRTLDRRAGPEPPGSPSVGVLRLHVLRRRAAGGGHRATTPGLRPAAPRLGHSSAQADTAAIGLSVDGQRRSARQAGLQHRSSKTVRPVRIPPELVALLHWHVTAYGTAPDGRLFQTQRGGLIQDGGYGEVWAEARSCALTAA